MNENKHMQDGCDKPRTEIESKLDIFQEQNRQIDTIWKDLYGFGDRLNNIAIKLNSINHPDNALKAEVGQGKPPIDNVPTRNDGIIGQIEAIQEEHGTLVNEFHNKIYGKLLRNIEYIEQHI